MGATVIDRGLLLNARIAADLMVVDPVSIRSEATAAEAMALFTEKGITAAPVIDDAGRPIGVLSRSDLLVHQVEQAKHRGAGVEYFAAELVESETMPSPRPGVATTAANLMTPAVFAVA